jgi:hypothetical protein
LIRDVSLVPEHLRAIEKLFVSVEAAACSAAAAVGPTLKFARSSNVNLHICIEVQTMSLAAVLLIADGQNGRSARGQDSKPAFPEAAERAERLKEMKQIAEAFRVVTVEQGSRVSAAFVREPLHRWTDPTRQKSDGTLWAWRSKAGRPVAFLALERHPANWSFELVSLATGPVEAEDGGLRWSPQRAGVEFRAVPGATLPSPSANERLRQMREIAKRFSGTEYWEVTAQHYPLRLRSHPIDRYADAASGLVDGAIFVFAYGTNPEAFLLIEANHDNKGRMNWSYAAAPLTTAAPTLKLDGKDVWSSSNKYGYLWNETYFFGERNLKRETP